MLSPIIRPRALITKQSAAATATPARPDQAAQHPQPRRHHRTPPKSWQVPRNVRGYAQIAFLIFEALAPACRARPGHPAARAALRASPPSPVTARTDRVKHALHARADVMHGDRLDLVFAQEQRYPGMMRSLGSLAVQCSPADRELLA